jgi:hypothetical protein
MTRLERCLDIGCAEVGRNELLRWYGQERVTVGIWRDIAERWKEILEETAPRYSKTPLLAGYEAGI